MVQTQLLNVDLYMKININMTFIVLSSRYNLDKPRQSGVLLCFHVKKEKEDEKN